MATTTHTPDAPAADERLQLGDAGRPVALPALLIGVVGVGVALVSSRFLGPGRDFARFYHAYLLALAFVLSLGLGGLFLTLAAHIYRAGWSASVRRVFETLAMTLPVTGVLALPILVPVWQQQGQLYPWAVPPVVEHHADAHASGDGHATAAHGGDAHSSEASHARDEHAVGEATGLSDRAEPSAGAQHEPAGAQASSHAVEHAAHHEAGHQSAYGYVEYDEFAQAKRGWLNPTFFTLRVIAYFAVWSVVAFAFYRASLSVDRTGNPEVNRKLSIAAPICFMASFVCMTFAAFDLVMSLDHHWYSTMFGVTYGATSMIGAVSVSILALALLQKHGYLLKSVTTEHFHDLGKILFVFVFFWGYTNFSQYMLIWYANIPETTGWFERRGATTSVLAPGKVMAYGGVALVVLFGHLLMPFAFLLSRHIKRNRTTLVVAACWMLAMSWVNLYWVILPELNNGVFYLGVPELAAVAGLGGLFVATVIGIASPRPLRPLRDPRLPEALAFHNM